MIKNIKYILDRFNDAGLFAMLWIGLILVFNANFFDENINFIPLFITISFACATFTFLEKGMEIQITNARYYFIKAGIVGLFVLISQIGLKILFKTDKASISTVVFLLSFFISIMFATFYFSKAISIIIRIIKPKIQKSNIINRYKSSFYWNFDNGVKTLVIKDLNPKGLNSNEAIT